MLTSEEKKERARWSRIKRTYGITEEDYDSLDVGHCPICLRPWGNGVEPVVDHRHSTKSTRGWVRGLLCRYCNKFVVGRLSDPAVVLRIWEYLRLAPTHFIVPVKKRKKSGKKSPRNTRSTRSPGPQ